MRNCCNLQLHPWAGWSHIRTFHGSSQSSGSLPHQTHFFPLSQRNPIVCLGFIKYTLILQFICFFPIYTHYATKELCIGLGKGGNSPWWPVQVWENGWMLPKIKIISCSADALPCGLVQFIHWWWFGPFTWNSQFSYHHDIKKYQNPKNYLPSCAKHWWEAVNPHLVL